MTEERRTIIEQMLKDPKSMALAPERLVAAAHHDAVFGTPLQQGAYTVVPAAEVRTTMGFGLGGGVAARDTAAGDDFGGGGGGGGQATARPVAAIVMGPDGVEVRPVVDVTKVVMGAFAAFGLLLFTARRMQRHRKRH